MNAAQHFWDDPEPDEDEIVTPVELWWRHLKCDACLREAVAKCYLDRSDSVQPARFSLCNLHTFAIAEAGGEVVFYE